MKSSLGNVLFVGGSICFVISAKKIGTWLRLSGSIGTPSLVIAMVDTPVVDAAPPVIGICDRAHFCSVHHCRVCFGACTYSVRTPGSETIDDPFVASAQFPKQEQLLSIQEF